MLVVVEGSFGVMLVLYSLFSDACANLPCSTQNMCYPDRVGDRCLCNEGYRYEDGNCVGELFSLYTFFISEITVLGKTVIFQ